tara:strand:+ start:3594 stop:3827 length:234 start_codon:yes stop_codon:yes gene_type:complete
MAIPVIDRKSLKTSGAAGGEKGAGKGKGRGGNDGGGGKTMYGGDGNKGLPPLLQKKKKIQEPVKPKPKPKPGRPGRP